MKKFLLLALAAIPLAGCDMGFGPGIKGSGTSKSETRTIGAFKGISLDGQGELIVKVGPKESLKVTGDDNLLEYIITDVKDGTLIIDTKESIRPKADLVFEITTPSLENLQIDGAGDVDVTGLSGGTLTVDVDGAGDLKAEGTVDKLIITIDGAGSAQLLKLKAKDVECEIDGAGDLKVYASESIDAKIDGAGSVVYEGNPKTIKKKVDGAGSINPS